MDFFPTPVRRGTGSVARLILFAAAVNRAVSVPDLALV
jgi:hypothetical protein